MAVSILAHKESNKNKDKKNSGKTVGKGKTRQMRRQLQKLHSTCLLQQNYIEKRLE